MSEWKTYKLGQLIDVKHGFAFKGVHITTEPNQNILVTPGNFNIGGGFKDTKFKYYTGNFPKSYILNKDDVVVTMTDLSQETDTLGYAAKVPAKNGFQYLHNQRIGLVQFISTEADKDFIHWLMRTYEYQGFIKGAASGTSIMHTSPTTIKQYEFLLPPIKIQERIAQILTEIENKIDLLNRQNQTLEALAETIFRQRFIEEENTWEEKPLDAIAEFLNGLACQKYPVKKGEIGLPVIKIKELKAGISEASDRATNDVPKHYIINNGDMLFSWSGSLDITVWFGGTGVLNQHLFKVSSNLYPQWLYYYWVKFYLPIFRGIANDKATTMGHIQRHHLNDVTVTIPDDKTLNELDAIFSPFMHKIKNNSHQIKSLTNLRDTLLPKLMSGELSINN